MPGIQSSVSLVELVQTLQEQQEGHAAATEAFVEALQAQQQEQKHAADAVAKTLTDIANLLSSLLGGMIALGHAAPASAPAAAHRAPSRPAPARAAAAPKPAPKAKAASPIGRSSYGVTGIDSVLNYVKKHGTPTTQELAKHWSSEGRGGKVDHTLSQLVKTKKLKRLPNPAGRGSRYTTV